MNKSIFYFRATIFLFCLVGLPVVFCGCASSSAPPAASENVPDQATFPTADKAVAALVDAIRSDNSDLLKFILGPESDQLISSGDTVADQLNKQKFLSRYDEKHALVPASDGVMTLTVGDDDWPLPIPLVQDTGGWSFDTEAGIDEIVSRRIGRNELSTIQVCLAIVDAQREYVQQNPSGDDLPQYAQKFFSDPGQKNGLFWETAQGETPSPLGPLVAEATDQGYPQPHPSATSPHPYHGYLYHILKSQGPSATGSAVDYIVNGKMIGGFAAVAYPAEYRNSGVMTFIVNHEGIVYQKDLGPDTTSIAESMIAFDPDSSWTKAQ
jgi:hypothetical protein